MRVGKFSNPKQKYDIYFINIEKNFYQLVKISLFCFM